MEERSYSPKPKQYPNKPLNRNYQAIGLIEIREEQEKNSPISGFGVDLEEGLVFISQLSVWTHS